MLEMRFQIVDAFPAAVIFSSSSLYICQRDSTRPRRHFVFIAIFLFKTMPIKTGAPRSINLTDSRTKSLAPAPSIEIRFIGAACSAIFCRLGERLRLPYGDKRFAPKKSSQIRIAGRVLYPFLSTERSSSSLLRPVARTRRDTWQNARDW